MNNQEAVIEQIIQNLAFEVEAVPKNINKSTSISQCMPLNVKIRVRKKDETNSQYEVSSASREIQRVPEKIRIVNSEQTIMTFDVFMEADIEKQSSQKSRKHFLDILRPGICLGDNNDDDGNTNVPSSSYSANVTERSGTTRSDGTLKHNFTLSKNKYQDYTIATQTGRQKWFFGRCKPGGCLDPPFSEDKYPYKPKEDPEEEPPDENTEKENENVYEKPSKPTDSDKDKICKKSGKPTEGDIKNVGIPTIFDNRLFKKRKKCRDNATNTKTADDETSKTDSILSIYPANSLINSLGTRSNSIITYPPNLSSDLRISENKSVKSRGTSEDKSRKSFNEHSEPCFIPPKGINRKKEKDMVYQKKSNQQNCSPNISDAGNKTKDSFKMPIPTPIPIPIPLATNHQNPECMPVTGDTGDKGLQNSISEKEAKTPEQKVSADRKTEDIMKNVKKLEKLTPDSINIDSAKQNPTKPHTDSINLENDDQNLRETMSKSDIDANNKNNDIEYPKEKNKTNLPILPIPIPINISSNKPDPQDNAALNNNINNIEECDVKTSDSIQSEQSFNDEIISQIIDSNEDSKDINQAIVTGKISRESESTITALIPKLEDSEEDITKRDSIPKNHPHNESVNQERGPTESEICLANLLTQETDIIKPESKEENIAEEIEHKKDKSGIKEEDKGTKLVDKFSKDYLENKSDDRKMIPDIKSNEIKDYENKNQKDYVSNASKTLVPSIDKTDISHNVPDNEKNNCNDINSQIHSDKESTTESPKTQKLNPEGNVYTDDGLKHINNNNFITAPVIIDKIEQSSYFGPVKQVYSETNLLNEPKITDYSTDQSHSKSKPQTPSSFKKFDEDNMTLSSQESIGIKSVTYDIMDDVFSSTSSKTRISSLDKQVTIPSNAVKENSDNISSKICAEIKDPVDDDIRNKPLNNKTKTTSSLLSCITSTNTLNSALKKDIFSVELGFQSYLNDKNERILKTFDATSEPAQRFPNDSVTIIKSQIRITSNEIRLPIDSDHDISIQIKKPAANQRVSISESGLVNMLDNNRKIKQKSPSQTNGGEITSPDDIGCKEIIEGDIADVNMLDLYEQELVPLQMIIKNLRDEIDVLAAQQMLYRDKIFSPKKSKLPRLVHSNRKCFGCLKK